MISLRVLIKLILLVVILADQGKCGNVVGFDEGISNCNGCENKIFKGDGMQLGKSSEDGEDTMCLQGHIEFCEELGEGTMVSIEIAKQTEIGSEPMWSCYVDLCESLKDDDAPWTAAMQAMEIFGCPINVGKYYCKNLTLDMKFMEKTLDDDNLRGSYDLTMIMEDRQMNTISCHKMGLAVKDNGN